MTIEGKRALNQHMHRHHHGVQLRGTLEQRLVQHDDLHFGATTGGEEVHELTHTHAPYQEGETDEQMAQRFLGEGAAQSTSE